MNISKIYILFWILVFSGFPVYGIGKADSLYKILRIKTNGDYYIIHAQRNDSLFKIISKRVQVDKNHNLELLKKGEYYYFVFGDAKHKDNKDKVEPLSGVANYLDVQNKYVFIDGDTKIKFTKRFHCRIYITKNLMGLYYVPNSPKED